MKNKYKSYMIVALGFLITLVGIFLLVTQLGMSGMLKPLPYILIGCGCGGTFGYIGGEIISKRMIKKHPEIKKQIEIDQNDERNIIIANKAKAKSFNITLFAFSALVIVFALIGVGLVPILLLVCAYLFIVVSNIYFLWKYQKEM